MHPTSGRKHFYSTRVTRFFFEAAKGEKRSKMRQIDELGRAFMTSADDLSLVIFSRNVNFHFFKIENPPVFKTIKTK